ncbi:MAG: DNA mismatch repair protein MutL [Firmicutes bacterium HGW-Firmicutes-16]|nr:MAG: DNA mismatch repair protein MutL [Firmicutes bacterium HGW-Firmicutes-16]
MSEINILSPHVADLIAAGEVVERPASVIKELIENSFDALAKNVSIEVRGGGMTYIRVTDDGCGMLPEDAGLCFMRHATSKLRDERGLEAIGTMGFRGEALAAIAAVSRIELITRKKGDDEGTRVVLEAGDIIEMSPHGCPEGTTLIVRDLFYNTPARLKFMKADRSEGSACAGVALRCALGRPEISVRLIKDGEEEFFSPGDGKISSCAYSLLGRDTAKELLECSSEDEGFAVSGFVSSPKAGHGNRTKQFFFVNGRSIKSQLLQAAVEQAYKNTLLTGRYPACVIYLTLSLGSVDVNVHPAKTEVKFRDEKKVFDSIYYAALSALVGETRTAEITLSPSTKAAASPKKDFYKSMSANEYREKYSDAPKAAPSVSSQPNIPAKPAYPSDHGTITWNRTVSSANTGTSVHESETPYRTASSTPFYEDIPVLTPITIAADEPMIAEVIDGVHEDFRLVGEAMKTYIVIEKGNELLLIDKHAAHERMIFDRLKKQGRGIMSQSLLIPITVKLSGGEIELLEKNSENLENLGFEIEPFGADSVIVRCVPADTDASDIAPMVEEICEKLKKGSSLSKEDALDSILHTVACKAAVKAGWNTEDDELLEIVKAVVFGEVKYCPHGRPVAVTLTKKQLDKEFSRIV